ncbi:MAG: FTR1 family iron permease, partial [Deltaproteobacteria bacterium]|nr:FTR1 family iron permease [Deltaproteobacteria bacterium]
MIVAGLKKRVFAMGFSGMVLVSCLWASPLFAGGDYLAEGRDILQRGAAAVQGYNPQNPEPTRAVLADLYLNHFEGSGLEKAMDTLDEAMTAGVENGFYTLIGKVSFGEDTGSVQEAWAGLEHTLGQALNRYQNRPTETGPWAMFWQSFLILIREGFEALLIVTALAAYLRRTGQPEKVNMVYKGVAWAVAASLGTAYVFQVTMKSLGGTREGVEGLTLVAASAVLFYVSYWLFSKREAARWQGYIKDQVGRAISRGSLWALGFAAFLAVYREGAETVLFYNALLSGAQEGGGLPFWGGMVLGLAGLGVLYVLMGSASHRLPMGLFFGATAGLMYYLAFVFAGKGVKELQGAGWLVQTPMDWMPTLEWLGVFPTRETFAIQL